MKKIPLSTLLSLTFTFLTTTLCASPIILGSIKFPAQLDSIEPISMYYDGRTINGSVHDLMHKITFELPVMTGQYGIYVLVVNTLPIHVHKPKIADNVQQNTIDYLKVPDNEPYVLYELVLVPDASGSTHVRWHITEKELPVSGKIPDHTLIVVYSPDLIEGLEGGSQLELPTIVLNNSLVALSHDLDVYAQNIRYQQLAAIDANTVHTPIKKSIYYNNSKTVVIGCIV